MFIVVGLIRNKQVYNEVLMAIKEFWPITIASGKAYKLVQKKIKFIRRNVVMLSIVCILSSVVHLSRPLIAGTLKLPFLSWYPVSKTNLPTYELLYVWQWFTCIVIFILPAFDVLMWVILTNISIQFILLQERLKVIFSGKHREYITTGRAVKRNKDNVKLELLIECIEYHQKLLKYYLITLAVIFY